ncbi:hypothetical protein ACHAQH_008447 [Verticillium albo-atrum]
MTILPTENYVPSTAEHLPDPQSEQAPHLPRILCLHGGGTNARIFRTQCRAIRAQLGTFFRFVFADGPYPSKAGPDVELVYANWGPFRSWRLPGYMPKHGLVAATEDGEIAMIDQSLKNAMVEDDKAGAFGPWVGLLGFSQGANLAASLLLRQQSQVDRGLSVTSFHFAVLLAGRAPVLWIESGIAFPWEDDPATESFLRLPTIHVHGLKDVGLPMHRDLVRCCQANTTRVVEWDGDHRVPIKSHDVAAVAVEILDVAKEVCNLI